MSEFEADFSAALRPVPGSPQPPSALDLDRARVHGRRLRRRRQSLQAGAAMAATALVAVLVTGPLSGNGGSAVAPASPTGTTANDPATTTVTFGWLPDGYHVSGGGTEGTFDDDLSAGNGKATMFVTIAPVPAGGDEECPLAHPPTADGVEVDRSCGADPSTGLKGLHWDVKPGSSQALANPQHYARLTWREGNYNRAALIATPGDQSAEQLTANMLRVAQNIRFGDSRPLPMPFHLAKPPTGLPLAYTYTAEGADGTPPGEAANGDPIGTGPAPGIAAGIEYGDVDATIGDGPGLEVAVQTADSDAAFPDRFELQIDGGQPAAADVQSTTVDGHPARIATKGGFEVLVVHDVNGFDVRLSVGGTKARAFLDQAGGLVGYFHTITVFSTDPATWTVDVLGK